MLKMNNNTTWSSNLKVERVTLSTIITGIEATKPLNNIKIWNQSNAIAVQSDKACDIVVYTCNGLQIANKMSITNININVPQGLYLVVATDNGQKKTEKVLIQ